jgi:L-fuculose-phosphate aldolase
MMQSLTNGGHEYPTDNQAKAQIVEFGRRMYAKSYVVANDGNISCKVSEDTIWTTPSGVSKGFMSEEMLVKTDLQGQILEGTCLPTTELKMHLRLYQENCKIRAVVHAHPPVATAFAIAGIPLDQAILAEAVVQLGTVPIASYGEPGTHEVPDSIAPFCQAYQAVLLANHGALSWGSNLTQAYFRMETLEYYATLIMYTSHIIGKANQLSDAQVERLKLIQQQLPII